MKQVMNLSPEPTEYEIVKTLRYTVETVNELVDAVNDNIESHKDMVFHGPCAPKEVFKHVEYGATIGGPIGIKNKWECYCALPNKLYYKKGNVEVDVSISHWPANMTEKEMFDVLSEFKPKG